MALLTLDPQDRRQLDRRTGTDPDFTGPERREADRRTGERRQRGRRRQG